MDVAARALDAGERAQRAAIDMTTFLIANTTRTVSRREYELAHAILSNVLKSLASLTYPEEAVLPADPDHPTHQHARRPISGP